MAGGQLIVLSAPSGAGKTTIARAVMQRHPEMLFSVSATTRPQRSGEMNGKDYFFLTKEEFDRRIQIGDLVEWEELFGNKYGTLKSEIERGLERHNAMLFDVDVKGALSIRRNFPNESVLIFIKPPSFEILKKRLEARKTETPEALKRRLERVPMELEKGKEFDFHIVNDDLQKAIDDVDAVVVRMLKSIQ